MIYMTQRLGKAKKVTIILAILMLLCLNAYAQRKHYIEEVNSETGDVDMVVDLDRIEQIKNRLGNITIDSYDAAADTTVYIKNSDGTYEANLDVEGDLIVHGIYWFDTGDYIDYDTANDEFEFYIGSVEQYNFSATAAKFWENTVVADNADGSIFYIHRNAATEDDEHIRLYIDQWGNSKIRASDRLAVLSNVGELKLYSNNGDVMIQDTVAGDVTLFETTDVDNAADGKKLIVHRKAAEGDISLDLFVGDDKHAKIQCTGESIDFLSYNDFDFDSRYGKNFYYQDGTRMFVFRSNIAQEQLFWGVADVGGNQLVFGNDTLHERDFDHPLQTNPTIFIHSDTNPNTDNTQWLSLTHDKTSSVLDSGLGGIKSNVFFGVNVVPLAPLHIARPASGVDELLKLESDFSNPITQTGTTESLYITDYAMKASGTHKSIYAYNLIHEDSGVNVIGYGADIYAKLDGSYATAPVGFAGVGLNVELIDNLSLSLTSDAYYWDAGAMLTSDVTGGVTVDSGADAEFLFYGTMGGIYLTNYGLTEIDGTIDVTAYGSYFFATGDYPDEDSTSYRGIGVYAEADRFKENYAVYLGADCNIDSKRGFVNMPNVGVYDNQGVLGSELCTSPNMEADDWTKGAGWSYNGTLDRYEYDGTSGGSLSQTIDVKEGLYYKIVFTTDGMSGDLDCQLSLGGNNGLLRDYLFSSVFEYNEYIATGSASFDIAINPIGSGNYIYINSCSVKAITEGDLAVANNIYAGGSIISYEDIFALKNESQDKDITFNFYDGAVAKTITIDASENLMDMGDTSFKTTGNIHINNDSGTFTLGSSASGVTTSFGEGGMGYNDFISIDNSEGLKVRGIGVGGSAPQLGILSSDVAIYYLGNSSTVSRSFIKAQKTETGAIGGASLIGSLFTFNLIDTRTGDSSTGSKAAWAFPATMTQSRTSFDAGENNAEIGFIKSDLIFGSSKTLASGRTYDLYAHRFNATNPNNVDGTGATVNYYQIYIEDEPTGWVVAPTVTYRPIYVKGGVSVFLDKIAFRADDNEFITGSLIDGELDLEATTSINVRINGMEQVQILDGIFQPTTDSDVDIGTTDLRFKDAFVDSLTVTDDVIVAGEMKGSRMLIGAGDNGVVGTSPLYLKGFNGMRMTATLCWSMPRAGSIVGVSATYNATSSDGATISICVYKNGAKVFQADEVNSIADHEMHDTQARGVDTFVAGDLIALVVEGVGVDNSTNDWQALCEIVFDD